MKRNNADYPEFLARFYNVIYARVRGGVDNEFYLRKIAASKGPVLEIGVGTGRIFIEALKKGADIYGVDNSRSMLDILRPKVAPEDHARIFLQDVRELELGRRFDLIIAPFRVFSHLLRVDEQIAVLDKVFSHLNNDGLFIFDAYVPNLKMLLEGIDNQVDFDGEYAPGKKLTRVTSMKADLINQMSDVSMKLVWEEDDREVEKEFKFRLRFFFRYELEHLVRRSPLKLVSFYGDFNENPLNSGSKEFVVVCRK
jgi:SAM-dependent methyltransferase